MTVKKYFLAIVIPQPLFDRVEAVKQKLFEQHGLRGALRSPAHITLHRPFEWKEEKENVLIERLKAFNFNHNFCVELNNFSFFEPRVIYVDVLPNNDLLTLQDALKMHAKKELKLFNEVNDLRGYHPHVTVASRDLKKPMFYELKTNFENQKLSGTFNCIDFSLLKLEKKWEVLQTFSFNNL